jgi:magnesium-protoporphyrin O-methyltransferase
MKKAQKEMERYLRKGPKKSTRWLLEPVLKNINAGDSILDIGGGVGALIMELQKLDIGSAYYMDISESYSAVFLDEVKQKLIKDKTHIQVGDFTEKHHLVPQADIVTLDKVLCCYQDFRQLLTLSSQKTRKVLAYTVPDNLWWVKTINRIQTSIKWFFADQLVTYVHPADSMESLVTAEGFHKVFEKKHTGWLTVVYRRNG